MKSSFSIIEFMESMENHYVDFSTCKQTLKKVSTVYHEHFEHLLSNSF